MQRSDKARTVVLISGRGSNLDHLIRASLSGSCNIDIQAVISNRPKAAGLNYARQANINTHILDHTNYRTRENFDFDLQELIDKYQPNLVLMAGFMRILNPIFVKHYQGRMLNIHPSLLPKYPGLHTHQRALSSGDHQHGATVHFVTEKLDGGPSIIQSVIPIHPDDNEDNLAARTLKTEHIIYPIACNWVAQGRLTLKGNKVLLDNKIMTEPIKYQYEHPEGIELC